MRPGSDTIAKKHSSVSVSHISTPRLSYFLVVSLSSSTPFRIYSSNSFSS